jgi:hypothetical protein
MKKMAPFFFSLFLSQREQDKWMLFLQRSPRCQTGGHREPGCYLFQVIKSHVTGLALYYLGIYKNNSGGARMKEVLLL